MNGSNDPFIFFKMNTKLQTARPYCFVHHLLPVEFSSAFISVRTSYLLIQRSGGACAAVASSVPLGRWGPSVGPWALCRWGPTVPRRLLVFSNKTVEWY